MISDDPAQENPPAYVPKILRFNFALNVVLECALWIIYVFFLISLLIHNNHFISFIVRFVPLAGIAAWLVTIICFALIFPSKTKVIAATGYTITSKIFMLGLATTSAFAVYAGWGVIVTLIGSFVFGYGIVGAAVLAAIVSKQWGLLILTAVSVLVVWLCQFAGRMLFLWSAMHTDFLPEYDYKLVKQGALSASSAVFVIGLSLVAYGYFSAAARH